MEINAKLLRLFIHIGFTRLLEVALLCNVPWLKTVQMMPHWQTYPYTYPSWIDILAYLTDRFIDVIDSPAHWNHSRTGLLVFAIIVPSKHKLQMTSGAQMPKSMFSVI
jgi:hypothetical protein